MNQFEKHFLTILIGDYILDEMNRERNLNMFPKPFSFLRDKYIKFKLKNLT